MSLTADLTDARFMAAAPELLSSLEAAIEIMVRAIGENLPIRNARAAIAKATTGGAL